MGCPEEACCCREIRERRVISVCSIIGASVEGRACKPYAGLDGEGEGFGDARRWNSEYLNGYPFS